MAETLIRIIRIYQTYVDFLVSLTYSQSIACVLRGPLLSGVKSLHLPREISLKRGFQLLQNEQFCFLFADSLVCLRVKRKYVEFFNTYFE